jgi:hypothetical protein
MNFRMDFSKGFIVPHDKQKELGFILAYLPTEIELLEQECTFQKCLLCPL